MRRAVSVPVFCLFAAMLLPAKSLASQCYSLAQSVPGVRYAALDLVAVEAPEVTIRYVSHSSYRIETPGGVSIVTDFYGNWGGGDAPDVVTMNHAHETHFTEWIHEDIDHVLRGWNPSGDGPAKHELRVGDVYIRNVPTNIRSYGGTELSGNSIFVFEVADLCIGHLGHLHHRLTEEHYAMLGRLDIVMAPVDGTYTLDLPDMIAVLKELKARIVLPMHAFSGRSLGRFIEGMQDDFAVVDPGGDSITVSLTTLPRTPTVMMMPVAFGDFGGD